MKHLYLPVLTIGLACLLNDAKAQSKALNDPIQHRVAPSRDAVQTAATSRNSRAALWSDDFSSPGTWVTANNAGSFMVPWQIGQDLQCTGDYPIATIQSSSADNGYALLDSDAGNNSVGTLESATLTTASPIDLSGQPNVVIQFESFYRKWTNEECYLVISTNNTDWPALTPTTDISGLPNVFKVWPDMAVQAPVANPTTVRINISDAAGDQPQVWVRFHWTGVWGYAWFLDDVAIIEQPANDVVMVNGFLSHTGEGEEYGRIPGNQLGNTMLVGGEVLNFGYEMQTNVQIAMEVRNSANALVFSSNQVVGTMMSGTTAQWETEVALPSLPNDIYTGTFNVVSNQEQDGDNFANNTYLRTFQITDEHYSLDGLGIHPDGYTSLGSLGTNSFADDADGFIMLVNYVVTAPITVFGVEFLISESSVAGAATVVSLHVEDDVLADEVGLPITQSGIVSITQAQVDAGRVQQLFPTPYTLQPGRYYASVEMYSNGNTNDVRILNDQTVPQPSLASMIYLPSAGEAYTNGNAAAIRLMTDPSIGIAETGMLTGISFHPNPSNGLFRFESEEQGVFVVEVVSPVGELVRSLTVQGNSSIDLSDLAKGAYMLRVSNAQASTTQRLVLQ